MINFYPEVWFKVGSVKTEQIQGKIALLEWFISGEAKGERECGVSIGFDSWLPLT